MRFPLAPFMICLAASPLFAQDASWRTSNPSRGPVGTPTRPQDPAPGHQPAERVPGMHAPAGPSSTPGTAVQPAAPGAARVPFQLTPQEQARVDAVLNEWERKTQDVRTFECKFAKLTYDLVFGAQDKPASVDEGTIQYAKPNQGLYEIVGNGAEKWCTDGKSFYQYKFGEKQVVEHVLGPEAQGTGFAHCPIPFIFGAKADDIKRRYWLRLITPAERRDEIWLETYPKTQADAANYGRVDVILDANSMHPKAIQVYHPGGKQRDVYSFGKPLVNDPLRVFKRGVFSGPVPFGWKKVLEPQTASYPQTRR
jgi:TIGR03009 family protein